MKKLKLFSELIENQLSPSILSGLCIIKCKIINSSLVSTEKIASYKLCTTAKHFNLLTQDEYYSIQSGKCKAVTTGGISRLVIYDKSIEKLTNLMNSACIKESILLCDKSFLVNDWRSFKNLFKHSSPNIISNHTTRLISNLLDSNDIHSHLLIDSILQITRDVIDKDLKKLIIVSHENQEIQTFLTLMLSSMHPSRIFIEHFDRHYKPMEKNNKLVHAIDDHFVYSPCFVPKNESILFKNRITAIINLYSRPSAVVKIYKQLISQSLPPSYIYIWINSIEFIENLDYLRSQMPLAKFIVSDENLGVWARFSYALNNTTEYTVVFDDDTIPGRRWLENCFNHFQKLPGLYGTVGLIFKSERHYMDHIRIGWPSANTSLERVDIVGHSWFFKTKWLTTYWSHFEYNEGIEFCGEDMHFSFVMQKEGINTYVPPHPTNNLELWGSTDGGKQGSDEAAISMSGKGSQMDNPLKRLIQRGFKLMNS